MKPDPSVRQSREVHEANKPCPGCGWKWCDAEWTATCEVCKEPVTMTNGYDEVIGRVHSGCFGYPMCQCPERHKGDCR